MCLQGSYRAHISLSRAKNVEEAAGDIRFCAFPQKTGENAGLGEPRDARMLRVLEGCLTPKHPSVRDA